MKDKSLVKIFSRLLSYDTEDIQKDINKGDVSETAARLFGSCRSALNKPQSKPSLTLAEVDDYLEQLSLTGAEEEKEEIFRSFMRTATPVCLQYFVRLVYHDLRMSAQAKHVLGALGPKAYDAFNLRQDLAYIVRTYHNNPNAKAGGIVRSMSGSDPSSSRLLTPMKPMLVSSSVQCVWCVGVVYGCSGCVQWVCAVGVCSGCVQWVCAVGVCRAVRCRSHIEEEPKI
jgi:ATP-dependent DNA ligase